MVFPRGMLLAVGFGLCCLLMAERVDAKIVAEASPGVPFGVGRITIDANDVGGLINLEQALLFEQDDRVLYPAISTAMPGRVLGQLLGTTVDGPPSSITWYFLVRGDGPLKLTVQTPARLQMVLDVRPEPPQRRGKMFTEWWNTYSQQTKAQVDSGDYSPLIQVYLQSMLSARLGLPPAQPISEEVSAAQKSVELLVAAERLRMEVLRETAMGRGDFASAADQPVPGAHPWPPLVLPQVPPNVAVEPIATRVPEECFYVRFGNFQNYLWLDGLMQEYSGDIASMVTLRGYYAPMNDRIQKQLGLKKSGLDKLLGSSVIADIALIGRDTYVSEGAAIGVLFQMKGPALMTGLGLQRSQWLNQEKANGATMETVKIKDVDVSFLSTPDNQIRSYLVKDGDFVLVTTSRTMAERFLETGKGERALASSEEFRFARSLMPLERDDTIFVYFSCRFFQELLSPQYQIEMRRRMQSVTDMEVLAMARLVAKAEGNSAKSMEELVAAGMLPKGFGRRPDGSGPVEQGEVVMDSRRGARGSYLPVPDVKLEAVTAAEQQRYAQLVSVYQQQWKQMDPLMIGLKRYALPLPPNAPKDAQPLERLVIDGNIAPLNEQKYAWVTSNLGPPTREFITPAPGDIISVQAVLRGGMGLAQVPPHHLFIGVQDMPPLGEFPPKGILKTFQFLKSTPGYLGGWPKPGYLDMLPFGLAGRPDAYGFTRMLFGLWRREGAGFSVLSFDFPLLAEVTQHLQVAIAENEAQVRVHVGDISGAQLSEWVHWNYFQRAKQASQSNVKLLHTLHQQLHVPFDECLPQAEKLLDAKLRCTLGGKYETMIDRRTGARFWRSTAWSDGTTADFQAPLLKWFRGLDLHLTKFDDRVVAHVELDMARAPGAPGNAPAEADAPKEGGEGSATMQLPFFNLFGGQGAFKAKEEPKGDKPLVPVPKGTKPPEEAPSKGAVKGREL